MAFNATVCLVLWACLASGAWAFGAGEIASVSNQAGRAFRHGDIEAKAITGLVKALGHHMSGSSIVQGLVGALASGSLSGLGNGPVFSENDVKRVYFGNWLRDYSQAMDIGGLSHLTADSIVLIVSILGFLTFGYGTREFEVTRDRLAVYLLTEHIDNPLGYGGEEDPQQYDPRLRPRVQREEMVIDPQNGMKAYIASEGRGFDTSREAVRRTLQKCIEQGRRGLQGNDTDLYEAYRLLGTSMHTLEDLSAHSNYVELCLLKMGHRDVFCYVGDNVTLSAQGRVPPLITGTFGGSDFIMSMLGEGEDKLSSSTITTLQNKMSQAQDGDSNADLLSKVQTIISKLPKSSEENQDKAQQLNDIKKNAINLDPSQVVPAESLEIFKQALAIRDDIMRNIESLLDAFPLVQDFIDELSDALTILVMSVVEPYLTPILGKLLDGIDSGSEAILKNEDQLNIFNDPNCNDPTHSVISKDHFSNQLNFVAGRVAVSVVRNAVGLIVEAWSDTTSDADRTIETILETFHHPFYATGRSKIQNDMFQAVEQWFQELGSEQGAILAKLTKDQVKEGNNKVDGSASMGHLGHGCGRGAHQKPSGRFNGAGQQGIPHGAPQGRKNFQNQGRKPFNPAEGIRHRPETVGGERITGGGYHGAEDRRGGYPRDAPDTHRHQSSSDRPFDGSPRYGHPSSAQNDARNTYDCADEQQSHGRSGGYRGSEQENYGRAQQESYGRTEQAYGQTAYGDPPQQQNYSGGGFDRDTRSSCESSYDQGEGERPRHESKRGRHEGGRPEYGNRSYEGGFGGNEPGPQGREAGPFGSDSQGAFGGQEESFGYGSGRQQRQDPPRFGRSDGGEDPSRFERQVESHGSHHRRDEDGFSGRSGEYDSVDSSSRRAEGYDSTDRNDEYNSASSGYGQPGEFGRGGGQDGTFGVERVSLGDGQNDYDYNDRRDELQGNRGGYGGYEGQGESYGRGGY